MHLLVLNQAVNPLEQQPAALCGTGGIVGTQGSVLHEALGALLMQGMKTALGLRSARGSRRQTWLARPSWLIPEGSLRKMGLCDFPSVRV